MTQTMRTDETDQVFLTLADFYAGCRDATSGSDPQSMVGSGAGSGPRIVHGLNPFPAPPGSEHDRAQSVTLASMHQAREVARVLSPDLEVAFAKVTLEADVPTPGLDFDTDILLARSVLDLRAFEKPRPLPLLMDILQAIPAGEDDIVVFTNVDIALTPSFYTFVEKLFALGVDGAIINRRTISGVYAGAGEMSLFRHEAGAPHPGFDCFALRGRLRDRLLPYDGCVGIGLVDAPLVYQLLAFAERPVVLLDAHATYHIGDDRGWTDPAFNDYRQHNRDERERVFRRLIEDPARRDRLVARLSGAHVPWLFPNALRALVGVDPIPQSWWTKGERNVRRVQRRLAALARR